MFRLNKSSNSKTAAAKSGERIDFRFSQFKALQVPKGWDKLLVSVIYVETGKTVAKSGKAVVRNGACQWSETLSESVWVSLEESSVEVEDCLFKLVLSMGSTRSGILGEAILNMKGYMNSSGVVPVSIPLKKCSHGTVLQLKIHCLTPRKNRKDESVDPNDQSTNSEDMEIKSDEADSTSARGVDSSSGKEEAESTGTSFPASDSQSSYDSANGENLSVDSGDNSISKWKTNELEDTESGSLTSNNQLQISDSSRSLLDVAEATIKELGAESKMWERSSQKLKLDMDELRKECSDMSRKQANLENELAAICAERDELRRMLEISTAKPTKLEESTLIDKGEINIQKQLEDEIKFHKESNASLALQLKRSRESNVELVAVLQELEETIEKQKQEIENLTSLQSRFSEMENSIQVNVEENKSWEVDLQQLQESEEDLKAQVKLLEQALQAKDRKMLSVKDDEINSLKAKLSESDNGRCSVEIENAELRREIEDLRAKLEELERDCSELTEENLDLLFKLKEIKSNSIGERGSLILPSSEILENSSSRSEVSDPEPEVHNLEEKLKKKVSRDVENHYDVQVQQLEIIKNDLEVKVTRLTEELNQKVYEMERLEAEMLSKDDETKYLQHCQKELQAKVASLQEEKILLDGNAKIITKERDIATKRLNDLQDDVKMLRRLERKSSDLESKKSELELRLVDVEHENQQLLDCISDLEDQLRSVMEEKAEREQEFKNSSSLKDEVARLRSEMESQKTELMQKLEEMQHQWLEAEEECEYLRSEHSHLQDINKSFVEDRTVIERDNEDLRKQNFELEDRCANLEEKLRESNESLASYCTRVSGLEENISSLAEDIALKERSFASQLDALLVENGKQMEKLAQEENLLKRKTLEIENLQREIQRLNEQLSAMKMEKDRIASEADIRVSSLLADKDKLERAVKELECEVQRLMNELAASKEDQEVLMSNHEKVLKLLETSQSSEEKCKFNMNDLELKLTVCEYERQKLMEEFTSLKIQLLKIDQLEDKIFSLKNELDATKSEKDKAMISMMTFSAECEDLKAQKLSFTEEISAQKKAMSELEQCKVVLDEKLLKMEEQNRELKNELSSVKRENSRFQLKIQLLEEEKDKFQSRIQALEEELNSIKEERQNQIESGNSHERLHRSSKIQSLETELAKVKEVNKKYKAQLDRLQSESRNINSKARKAKGEGEVVTKERFERTKSSLESELKDIRERYLQMSLKYAEVEAEREELVMKLKVAKNGKRWFS